MSVNHHQAPAKLALTKVTGVTSLSNICSVGPLGAFLVFLGAIWCFFVLGPSYNLACYRANYGDPTTNIGLYPSSQQYETHYNHATAITKVQCCT